MKGIPVSIDGAGSVLRMSSRCRSVLAANTALCDIYVFDVDGLLRMYNPKGAGRRLRCVQLLRPQLLDDAFLCATPGFWSRSTHEQARLVADAFGAGRSLDEGWTDMLAMACCVIPSHWRIRYLGS